MELESVPCSFQPYIRFRAHTCRVQVLAAYSIELSLGAMLLLSQLWVACSSKRHADRDVTQDSRKASKKSFSNVVQSALCVFWDSSVFFSLGVGIAGLVMTSKEVSRYDSLLLIPALSIAVLILTLLWDFTAQICSFHRLRRATLLVTTLLAVVVVLLAVDPSSLYFSDLDVNGDFFLRFCLETSGSHGMLEWMYIWTIFIPVLVGVNIVGASIKAPWKSHWSLPYGPLRFFLEVPKIAFTVKMNPIRVWCKELKGKWQIAARTVDLVFFTTLLLLLCLHFHSFVAIRRLISTNVQGGLDQDQWGFGQVLAVTAWVPAVLELVSVARG